MKTPISTPKAPAAIGPYSQAISYCNLTFVSGQLPIDSATGALAGSDITSQTRQSLENIRSILEEAGLTMDNVVKSTVYLANMEDFAAMNSVYSEFFTAPYPARAAFQVAKLPKDALVEIEVIAAK